MNETVQKDSLFRKALLLGAALFFICGLSTALMAFVHVKTEGAISKAVSRRLTEGFRLLVPGFDNDIMRTASARKDGCTVYTAMKERKLLARIVTASVKTGYAGEIQGMASFDADGKMTGFLITRHGETPGLGGNVCGRKETKTILNLFRNREQSSSLPPNSFLDSFIGHSMKKSDSWKGNWNVRKDGGNADQVSGATITSRAVAELAAKAAKAVLEEEKR